MFNIKEIIKYYLDYSKQISEDLKENILDPNFCLYAAIFLGLIPFAYIFSNTFAYAHFTIYLKMYIALLPISKVTLSCFFPFFGFFSSFFCLLFICVHLFCKSLALELIMRKHEGQFTTEQKIAIFFICFKAIFILLLGVIFFGSIMYEMRTFYHTGYRPILELMWYWNGLIDYEMYCFHLENLHEYVNLFRVYKLSPLMADHYAVSFEMGTYKPDDPLYKISKLVYETIGTKHLSYLKMLKSLKY